VLRLPRLTTSKRTLQVTNTRDKLTESADDQFKNLPQDHRLGLVLPLDRARRLLALHRGLAARPAMCASDVTATLDPALAASGLDRATVMHRLRLLSDNGSSYVASDLAAWLEDKGMEYVRGAPYHPQTQGKIERWHQTLKNRILLDNYYLPGDLEQQVHAFVEHYNHARYHESIDNLTPADVYFGRAETIFARHPPSWRRFCVVSSSPFVLETLFVNRPFNCGLLSSHFFTFLFSIRHGGSVCPVGTGRGCGDGASAGWRYDRKPYSNLTLRHRRFPMPSR